MTITMQNLERLSVEEMGEFIEGSRTITFAAKGRETIYPFIEGLLKAMWATEMSARRSYSGLPKTSYSRWTMRCTAGPDRSSWAASTAASSTMSSSL